MPLHVSPFSAQEQQTLSWGETIFSPRPGAQNLRYRALLLAVFTFGVGSMFFHWNSSPAPAPAFPSPPMESGNIQANVPQSEVAQSITNDSLARESNRSIESNHSLKRTPRLAWTEMTALTQPRPSVDQKPKAHLIVPVFTGQLPVETKREVAAAYTNWKNAHGEGFSDAEVNRFMKMYAPDARVTFISGETMSLAQLRSFVSDIRRAGFYSKVYDLFPQSWKMNPNNSNQVEIVTNHLYEDEGNELACAPRRLVWQKRRGEWKIIEDNFPILY